jgi:hypothetical protein
MKPVVNCTNESCKATYTSPINGTTYPGMPLSPQQTFVSMWMSGENQTTANDTTYYLMIGLGYSDSLADNQSSVDGLTVGRNGSNWWWVSAVKCKAKMWYQVSNCQWNGESMIKCLDLEGTNITQVDTVGLSRLSDILNSLPITLYNQGDQLLGLPVIAATVAYSPSPLPEVQSATRGPRIKDYVNMYGGIAYSMVQDMSNGYYGTIVIPSEDTISDFVYSVRLPMLFLVDLMVLGCFLCLLWDFVASYVKDSPIREMSFIAIAAATRGKWWDDCTDGLCVASQTSQRKIAKAKVTFGVDPESVQHTGLAPRTTAIVWNHRYRGTL